MLASLKIRCTEVPECTTNGLKLFERILTAHFAALQAISIAAPMRSFCS